jgi:hypothetical protein
MFALGGSGCDWGDTDGDISHSVLVFSNFVGVGVFSRSGEGPRV